ncbi:MAG: AlpA family phage regulatory protein [Deltaproteobacteria bacterium]|jgi:predicted DNA-binding transcriptional regulator AlpA|nr:AlpA family phage regulatory protein [Deltaproteobacteria bacterium]
MEQAYIQAKKVAKMIGISLSSVYRFTREDQTFPKPIRLGQRINLWDVAEIVQWLEERKGMERPRA